MRRKKVLYTIVTDISLQAVVFCIGLILPRLIISTYGSATNGLINSITTFLSYVSLLEGGVESVARAALYKVLAKNDKRRLSSIMISIRRFFKRICIILIAYVVVLCFVYPTLVAQEFDAVFTISLLVILAASTFMQYFVGISNQTLLLADQKGYVINLANIITRTLSAVVMALLVINNVDIRIVKGVGTIILVLSPLFYAYYVKRHYNLETQGVEPDEHALSQKWSGFAHQMSAFIHNNTDVFILSIFSTMQEVSVYSVYASIIGGVKKLLNALTSGVSAAYGNLYGSGKMDELSTHFKLFNYFTLLSITFIFTLAGAVLGPFVQLYTSGIHDVNYVQPVFGTILLLAEAIYCIRVSYSNLIFVVGDFKPTRFHGYIEAGLNIIVSLALLKPLGLVGIAVGTMLSMTYRCMVSIAYVNKRIMPLNIKNIIKKWLVNISAILLFIAISSLTIKTEWVSSYGMLVVYALINAVMLLAILLAMNIIFCKKDFLDMYNNYIGTVVRKITKGHNKK